VSSERSSDGSTILIQLHGNNYKAGDFSYKGNCRLPGDAYEPKQDAAAAEKQAKDTALHKQAEENALRAIGPYMDCLFDSAGRLMLASDEPAQICGRNGHGQAHSTQGGNREAGQVW
jgi:hypothetical protein